MVLTVRQKALLILYLTLIDTSKIDVKKLIREIIIRQVEKNPYNSNVGKYDLWCGHNRTLAYCLEDAEGDITVLELIDKMKVD